MVLINSMMTKAFFNWKNKSRDHSGPVFNWMVFISRWKKEKKTFTWLIAWDELLIFEERNIYVKILHLHNRQKEQLFLSYRLVSFTYHNGQTTLISDCQIPNGNNYFPIPPIPVLCVEVSLEESEGVLIQVFLLYYFYSLLSTPYSQMKSRMESKGLVGWSEVRWVLILFFLPAIFPLSASYLLTCFMM